MLSPRPTSSSSVRKPVIPSVMPNLLVVGVVDALRVSTAVRIYVCNVFTPPGKPMAHQAADHLQAVLDHAGADIVDYVLVNSQRDPARLVKRYREEGGLTKSRSMGPAFIRWECRWSSGHDGGERLSPP